MKTFIGDTSAWISYFEHAASPFKPFIEGNYLETSAVVLGELTRVLARKKVPESKRKEILDFVLQNSLVLPLTAEHAMEGGILCESEGLHFVDGLIYAYASAEKKVLSGDQHFSGKRWAEYVPAP